MTELAIIGSDIQEVIGSSIALFILFEIPLWLGAIITIFDSLIFLFLHYWGVRKLEFLFAFFMLVMSVSFCFNMVEAKPDYGKIAHGTIVPSVPSGAMTAALGLIGADIMPHNFYLHSALVLSRKINSKNKTQVNEACIYNNIESSISLFISFFINSCVIATFAAYREL